jgi:dolichol-phosphate mannosyltransferase
MPSSKQSHAHVVVVLPTYNESENIEAVIAKLQKAFKTESLYRFSILVVDDNSPDGTAAIVKKLIKSQENLHLLTGKKKGLGAAYIKGMTYAVEHMDAKIMFEMDSDLSHDPAVLPNFLRKIEEGYDLVVGSRYIPGGSIPQNWPWYRKLFSVFGNFVVRFGLLKPHVKEWTNGYRAVTTEAFLAVKPGLESYHGYIFQIAQLHRILIAGFRVGDTPIAFIDRTKGKSKIIPYEYIPEILKYVLMNSSFIKYVITGGFGFVVDFGVAFMLISLFLVDKPIANAMSAETAIIFNFFINNFWSFAHKKINGGIVDYVKKFIMFNLVASGSIAMQYGGMVLALAWFGDKVISFGSFSIESWIVYKVGIIAFFIIPYSFVMYNKVVWRTK